jgi:AcrR family transcriptional regulator
MTGSRDAQNGPGARQAPGSHPAPRELSAYHAGDLPPAEVEAIQDHLALCAECTRALLALPHLYAELEATDLGERPDAGAEAAWQALRARLPTPLFLPREEDRRRPPTAAPRAVYALAAGLAACLLGLSAWVALQGGPRAAPPVAVSLPGAEITRGVPEGEPISVHLAAGSEGAAALLALPLPPGPDFPSYRLEIRAPGGKVRLTAIATPAPVAAPAPLPAGAGPRVLSLVLAPGSLPPGDYRLRVLGLHGGRGEPLAERILRVSN